MRSSREAALLLLTATAAIDVKQRDETPLHRVADAHYQPILLAVSAAFMRGKKAYKSGGSKAAVSAIRASLIHDLPKLLTKAYNAGGEAAQVPKLKAAATKIKTQFDAPNSNAANWALTHATKIADDISQTSKDDIAEAVARAQEEGDLREQYDDILDAVGDEARASLIARTESMTAANEGNRDAWDQAVENGLLDADAKRVWIATSDACPECEDLDGEETTLDGEYPGDGGDGPPLHPNCRCTEGIVG